MSYEKMSKGFALNIQKMLSGEAVNASAFGNKRQLKILEDDRVITRVTTGRNRSIFRCGDPCALESYLRLHFGIVNLEVYIDQLEQENRDGEDSLQATVSTKMLRQKSLQGFFIKAFKTEVKVQGKSLELLPEGVEYFVRDSSSLQVSTSALVIGVENPECFVKAERLCHLFPQQDLIFVLRYYGKSAVRWLKRIPNNYLHFGDFDPAGIAIYCNEFLAELGEERCRFFVPSNMESLIKIGQTSLFDQQQQGWPPRCEINQPKLVKLIELINRYGKGAEQELLFINIHRHPTGAS